jgi:putative DNA methylase
MTWDFAEANVFGPSSGSVDILVEWIAKVVALLPTRGEPSVTQADVRGIANLEHHVAVATDPPYYDNIGYADLSDFFYIWLRPALRRAFPELMGTLLSPKSEELIASPFRHGGRQAATLHFTESLREAFSGLASAQTELAPLTLFYAFKQAERSGEADRAATASTGWESMLSSLLESGLAINGTWPVRTERLGRSVALGTNALASSIVLVCRPRPDDAPTATRREFITALKAELPEALRHLQKGNIAPVDLAQASIGPGMAVFSRYKEVLEASGEPMRVRTALELINQILAEVLTEQEAELDPSTRFAVSWFEQYGMDEGVFGQADVLARAYDVAVDALDHDGILTARRGKVRIVPWMDLTPGWDPRTDNRPTVWEATHHLIKAHQDPEGGSEQAAAELLRVLGEEAGEHARDLAYRLYVTCERKGWADEALAYNALVVAWPELKKLAVRGGVTEPMI